MRLRIIDIIVKIITAIILLVLMPIVIVIAGAKTLFDGIVYEDWHKADWADLPVLLCDIYDYFKLPIFD